MEDKIRILEKRLELIRLLSESMSYGDYESIGTIMYVSGNKNVSERFLDKQIELVREKMRRNTLRDSVASVIIGILIGVPWSLYAITTVKGPKVVTVTQIEKQFIPVQTTEENMNSGFDEEWYLDWYLDEIQRKTKDFYMYADSETAEALYPGVREIFPEAVLIQNNGIYYIAVDSEGIEKLTEHFDAMFSKCTEDAMEYWYRAKELREMQKNKEQAGT